MFRDIQIEFRNVGPTLHALRKQKIHIFSSKMTWEVDLNLIIKIKKKDNIICLFIYFSCSIFKIPFSNIKFICKAMVFTFASSSFTAKHKSYTLAPNKPLDIVIFQ